MITIQHLNTILKEELQKAKELGLNTRPINPITELPKAHSFYGQCRYEYNGSCTIRISYYFLDAPENQIRQTIAHEICHAVYGTHGHDAAWRAAANKFNQAYGYTLKRVGGGVSENEKKWSLDGITSRENLKAIHIVECPCCHNQWRRIRESNLTLHPEFYKCGKCKTSLVRIQ